MTVANSLGTNPIEMAALAFFALTRNVDFKAQRLAAANSNEKQNIVTNPLLRLAVNMIAFASYAVNNGILPPDLFSKHSPTHIEPSIVEEQIIPHKFANKDEQKVDVDNMT